MIDKCYIGLHNGILIGVVKGLCSILSVLHRGVYRRYQSMQERRHMVDEILPLIRGVVRVFVMGYA